MSSVIGDVEERWPLARAVDALGDAARQAGPPGWIWIAGFAYPAVSLWPGLSGEQVLGVSEFEFRGDRAELELLWLVVPPLLTILMLLPVLGRLWVGLARISTPGLWKQAAGARRRPRLRDAWRAGRGLGRSAFGLWLQVMVLQVAALLLFGVLPGALLGALLADVSGAALLLFFVLGPLVAFLLFYLLLLNLLFQIALHSLAQNRRGAASALTHAWRIARNDPWATARATLVDFLLYVTVLILAASIVVALAVTCVGIPLIFVVLPGLAGFFGVTRASYWARAYRALGGLSPEDRVPGLDEGAASSPAQAW